MRGPYRSQKLQSFPKQLTNQHLQVFRQGMEKRDVPYAGNRGIDVDITFLLPGSNNHGILLLDSNRNRKFMLKIILQKKTRKCK